MRTIESRIIIDRPPADVWDILSDLTAMRHYMPGIDSVRLTSKNARGEGAARHCVFADGVELSERVTRWDEGRGMVLETTAFKKVPMKSNEITFALREQNGATVVTQSMRYAMKGGLLAPIMERVAGGMMDKAVRGALAGLKTYAEARA